MEDKNNYDQLNSKDLEVLENKIFDIKGIIKIAVTKLIKDIDYEFPEHISNSEQCFCECVKLISIKSDLTNLLNDLDTGINQYIELEKSAFNK